MQQHRLSGPGPSKYRDAGVLVFFIIERVDAAQGIVLHVDAENHAVHIVDLIGRKGERGGEAGRENVAAAFPLQRRRQGKQRQAGEVCLLLPKIAVFGNQAQRSEIRLRIRKPLFKEFRAGRSHLDQCGHIIKILVVAVHLVLEKKAGSDCRIQLFKILARIVHIAHPCPVEHSRLGDF